MLSVARRIDRIFDGSKADVVLVANRKEAESNFTYLSGFVGGSFERACIVASRDGRETLFVSPLEYEVALDQKPKEMRVIQMGEKAKEELKRLIRGKAVGFDGDAMTVNTYKRYRKLGPKTFFDVSSDFARARAVKDAAEIKQITAASDLVKKMLRGIPDEFQRGMTETSLAKRIDDIMREFGAEGPAFHTIVAFGENSAVPHHVPTGARLTPNSFVKIDCGARLNNYCSDITRTFIFEPDKGSQKYAKMKEMREAVEKAQAIGMENIAPGVAGSVPHNAVAKFIDTVNGGKYKGKFTHSLGHPLGLETHDPGVGLGPFERGKLEMNMVVSNEPGIYIKGFGGVRIEDDVLVTKTGAKII